MLPILNHPIPEDCEGTESGRHMLNFDQDGTFWCDACGRQYQYENEVSFLTDKATRQKMSTTPYSSPYSEFPENTIVKERYHAGGYTTYYIFVGKTLVGKRRYLASSKSGGAPLVVMEESAGRQSLLLRRTCSTFREENGTCTKAAAFRIRSRGQTKSSLAI